MTARQKVKRENALFEKKQIENFNQRFNDIRMFECYDISVEEYKEMRP